MSAAIGLRQDFDAATLRRLATAVKDPDQVRRLLAVAAVYDGMSREEAARIGGMDRQTLRDWVLRFNERGPEGLINAKSPGRPPTLSEEQMEELRHLVEAGPDPEKDGVARWRCVDLKRVLGARFGVDLSEVSLGRCLRKLGFSHISARPRHPKQDPEAIATFKKKVFRLVWWRPQANWPWQPRSRCGFRMKCGSGKRTRSSTSGPRRAHVRGSQKINVMRMPICSAPSAPVATPGSPSSCRMPTLRRCANTSKK